MQKVLIIDNDYQDIQNIFNNINANSSIKIIGICDNEKDATKYIINENIDIIILGLEIPNVKNLFNEIIENDKTSKIIAISNKPDSIINIINKNIDVYKFFIKPLNIVKLTDTLNNIAEYSENIENNLINLLKDFNFNKNTKGYSYILKCLTYCIENNYTYISSIKALYKEMELKYNNINSSQLEWNIAKSIHSMINYTNEDVLDNFLKYNISPSPKVFINGILNLYFNKKSNNYCNVI